MGNLNSVRKINFEDMQTAIKRNYLIINTMPPDLQGCLIHGTIHASLEEEKINQCIHDGKDIPIIIYGKNTNDEKVIVKYKQLVSFGFKKICVYLGGMFEWLLLQDIYGVEEFPTTQCEKDILKYKSIGLIN
jgi:hypothetical protein